MQRSVLAALFGAAACIAVVAMTDPPGPGLDPDSISYLGAAESLVRHGSLRVPFGDWWSPDSTSPLAHFPPLFSIAIAGPAALGAPPVQTARAIEAVSALATVGGAVWLVAGAAGPGAGAVAGLALLASPSLAFDHWQVLSEPLCLALLVLTLGLMAGGARPWRYGLAAALAGLVRYAGAAAMGAAVLWAYGRSGAPRERLRRAAEAAIPGLLLHGAWVVRERLESGTIRSFGWRGHLAPAVAELGRTLGSWLAPLVTPGWPQAVLALAVAGVAALLLRRAARAVRGGAPPSAPGRALRLIGAAGLLAACYAALVLWSRLFVDESIPFDERLLSPLILLLQLAVAAALGIRWAAWSRRGRVAAAAMTGLWLAASAVATVGAVRDALDGGWGYASDDWRTSSLAEWLRADGRGAAIFSNNPAAVFALTHRPSWNVPGDLAADSLAAFARAFGERPSVLVRFSFDLEPGARPDSIAKRLGLREIAVFPDGAVWGAPALPAAARGG